MQAYKFREFPTPTMRFLSADIDFLAVMMYASTTILRSYGNNDVWLEISRASGSRSVHVIVRQNTMAQHRVSTDHNTKTYEEPSSHFTTHPKPSKHSETPHSYSAA